LLLENAPGFVFAGGSKPRKSAISWPIKAHKPPSRGWFTEEGRVFGYLAVDLGRWVNDTIVEIVGD
jgi:hypothetical protein